jgi:trans-2-enoyl-CoA reductase
MVQFCCFEKKLKKQDFMQKSVNGDAFSDEVKNKL